jgi:hypothetical protein
MKELDEMRERITIISKTSIREFIEGKSAETIKEGKKSTIKHM